MWKFTLEEEAIVSKLVKINKTNKQKHAVVASAAEGAQKRSGNYGGGKVFVFPRHFHS